MMTKVKFYGVEEAPQYATEGSSGFDLKASKGLWLHPKKTVIVPTGLHVELPKGYELQVRARSGFTLKHDVIVKNGIGTIDSDYRGEIGVILYNIGKHSVYIAKGERIAQGVVSKVEHVEFVAVKELSKTKRGKGGFGHTGDK